MRPVIPTRLGNTPTRGKKNRRLTSRNSSSGAALGPVLKILLSWAIGAATIAGAALGVNYGWEALRRFDKLRVKHIEISGAVRALEEDVLAYAGIKAGDSTLDLDLDDTARAILRHPWIESVQVKRRLPDKVTIEITEHAPVMLVALADVYVANHKGELFKRVDAADQLVLPVLTGLSRELTARDTEASAARVREAVELASTLQFKGAKLLGRTDELHWDDVLGWSVVFAPERAPTSTAVAPPVLVHMGRDPLAALEVALRAASRLQQLGGVPAELWADGKKDARFVQVRLTRSPSSAAETLIATAR